MKKQNHIEFKAILLLLLYIVSSSPSMLFHHHKLDFATYDKATSCEKAIYYSEKDSKCHHKTHLSKTPEKCFLCDNHNLSPHSLSSFSTRFFCAIEKTAFSETIQNYYFQSLYTFSNKGPPAVSSFTV